MIVTSGEFDKVTRVTCFRYGVIMSILVVSMLLVSRLLGLRLIRGLLFG